VFRRSLSRTGFQIDHVQYYCDALKPWITHRKHLEKFVLRRDPRDISRVWALDPEGEAYVQVPYRTLSRPPISAWEQRAATARLREKGRKQVDENALFAMVEQMHAIAEEAAAKTRGARKARRDLERRSQIPAQSASRPAPPAAAPPPPDDISAAAAPARPFEVIEQW
jgi:putative transposase